MIRLLRFLRLCSIFAHLILYWEWCVKFSLLNFLSVFLCFSALYRRNIHSLHPRITTIFVLTWCVSVCLRVCMRSQSHSNCIQLFATPCAVARQAALSVEVSRQEYWSGLPCPPPGDLPEPGIEPASLTSPASAGRFFTTIATWEAPIRPITYKLLLYHICTDCICVCNCSYFKLVLSLRAI